MHQRKVSTLYITVAAGGIISAFLWWFLSEVTRGLSPETIKSMLDISPPWVRGFIGEMGNGFWYENDNNSMPTAVFLVLQVVQWAILVVVFAMLHRQRDSPQVTWLIVVFAMIFRFIMVGSVPIHENDFYRYLWDGKSMRNGINPYLYEPAAVFLHEQGIEKPILIDGVELQGRPWKAEDLPRLEKLQELRSDNQQLYDRIGHRQVPTIYPPLAQCFFALSSFCFEDSLLGLKAIILIFDLGCIGLIVALLILLKRSTAAVILYAWSPLAMVEFANSAHYDSIPVFFLLLCNLFFGWKEPGFGIGHGRIGCVDEVFRRFGGSGFAYAAPLAKLVPLFCVRDCGGWILPAVCQLAECWIFPGFQWPDDIFP